MTPPHTPPSSQNRNFSISPIKHLGLIKRWLGNERLRVEWAGLGVLKTPTRKTFRFVSVVLGRCLVAKWDSISKRWQILFPFPFCPTEPSLFSVRQAFSHFSSAIERDRNWSQSEIEVTSTRHRSDIYMNSGIKKPKWHQSEIEATSKWVRSQIGVKSKWNLNGCGKNRGDLEVKAEVRSLWTQRAKWDRSVCRVSPMRNWTDIFLRSRSEIKVRSNRNELKPK